MTGGDFWIPPVAGLDPFDALRGSNVPAVVRGVPLLRQGAIQLRKRLPLDISRLLGIEPFVMAKTVGCMLTACSRAQHATGCCDEDRVRELVDALDGCDGRLERGAWGYEFDVQTRWAYYPKGSSNLIATAFVGRGLLSAGEVYGSPEWARRGLDAAEYALERFLRPGEDGRDAFFYTVDTARLIHNANMLGVALCVDASPLMDGPQILQRCRIAAEVSMDGQRDDGSWPYGDLSSLTWVDSFHTAYVLDGLLQLWLATGDDAVGDAIRRGASYWERTFFGADGEPHYHAGGTTPYDIHAAATAVDVSARLASWGLLDAALPRRVAEWTRVHLTDPDTGGTYYREGRFFTDRRRFVRWGDAHWALARASLLLLDTGRKDPVEERIARVGR